MRKVALQEFVTVDGVMESPEKWNGAAWSDELEAYARDRLFEADCLLLGRATYEIFASSWPSRSGDDFSDRINGLPKFVVSRSLREPTWNSSVLQGSIADEVGELKAQAGRDILVYGSGQLVNALMDHDLIDDYRLWVFPVVFGAGKRLFEQRDTKNLQLDEVETFGTGVTVLSYTPVRAPTPTRG
jgi:dihydrofolate reductase